MVTPRRIRFEYPADTSPMWTPDRPEFACAANSVSLMMPAIEPYFVRSIRGAAPRLQPPLAQNVDAYLVQESQHFRQHLVFNKLLIERYKPLARLEPRIRRTYRWLEDHRSAEFSLAFAASSEIMAYSAARWASERRHELFNNADERAATLFLWHLAEEVEHKTVAHDVYEAIHPRQDRSMTTYLGAMFTALTLVLAFVIIGTTVTLAGERRLHNPLSWFRLGRWAILFAFELLTNLTLTLFASFHPDQLADPLWYEVWLRDYDPKTQTMPLWNHADRVTVHQDPQPTGTESQLHTSA